MFYLCLSYQTQTQCKVIWNDIKLPLNNANVNIIYIYIAIDRNNVNLLKPTGYVTHQQFNIQQLYALPTLYLCVLYLSESVQRLVPLTA